MGAARPLVRENESRPPRNRPSALPRRGRFWYVPAVLATPDRSGDFAGRFDATHWSVVLAAQASGSSSSGDALAALTQLCKTYWTPLYGVVRGRGHSVHDAQDLTQGFFTHLIENRLYARADQQRGPFRSFLLVSLRNFLANAHDHQQALKRGGGLQVLPLDEYQSVVAENLFQTCQKFPSASGEDRQFEQQWARALVRAALDRVAQEYRTARKAALFENLQAFLKGGEEPLPSYESLAAKLGIEAVTLRSHVARLRSRFREVLREEVRRTVGTPEAVDEELRELRRVLSAR